MEVRIHFPNQLSKPIAAELAFEVLPPHIRLDKKAKFVLERPRVCGKLNSLKEAPSLR